MIQHKSHGFTEKDGDIMPSYDGVNGAKFTDVEISPNDVDASGVYVAYIPEEELTDVRATEAFQPTATEPTQLAPIAVTEIEVPPAPRFWTPCEPRWSETPSDDSRELRRIPDSVIEASQSQQQI